MKKNIEKAAYNKSLIQAELDGKILAEISNELTSLDEAVDRGKQNAISDILASKNKSDDEASLASISTKGSWASRAKESKRVVYALGQ